MRELLLIFNDVSKATLESEIHSKVGQTSWNLGKKKKKYISDDQSTKMK